MFDPKKLASMMRQMGIKTSNISANRVVIEKSDGTFLVIENPELIEITMQGQRSYQLSGNVREESLNPYADAKSKDSTSQQHNEPTEEDIELVMQAANTTREKALEALKQSKGNVAQAIVDLTDHESDAQKD